MKKIINPPCSSWKPSRSSCLMKRRRELELLWKARVVVMRTVPEQPRMLGCPLLIGSSWSSLVCEVVVSEEARGRVEDEGTEADDESEIISVGGPLSIVCGCNSEGVTFEEAVGRTGLISETETSLYTAGLPIC